MREKGGGAGYRSVAGAAACKQWGPEWWPVEEEWVTGPEEREDRSRSWYPWCSPTRGGLPVRASALSPAEQEQHCLDTGGLVGISKVPGEAGDLSCCPLHT